MFNVILDYGNLSDVFSRYSVVEAIKVKHNIETTLANVEIPSKQLLEEMAREGISLEDLDTQGHHLDMRDVSNSVIRAHLHTLFLDQKNLQHALTSLSMSQRIQVRDYLDGLISLLKLPSATLLERMQNEGVLSSVTKTQNEKVSDVKRRLEEANQQQQQQNQAINSIKQRLASHSMPQEIDELKLARSKALLNKAAQPEDEFLPQLNAK